MFREATAFELAAQIRRVDSKLCTPLAIGPDREGRPNRTLALECKYGSWAFRHFQNARLCETRGLGEQDTSFLGILAIGCIDPSPILLRELGLDDFKPMKSKDELHPVVCEVGPDSLVFCGAMQRKIRLGRKSVIALWSPPELQVPARDELPFLWLIDPREVSFLE